MPETNETQMSELLVYAEQLQAQVEQLQQANSQLLTVNTDLRRQMQQYADPLISYGEGVHRVVLNARGIKGMSLRELTETDARGAMQYKEVYCLVIDELQATPHLPPEQAQKELSQAQMVWAQALQPPN